MDKRPKTDWFQVLYATDRVEKFLRTLSSKKQNISKKVTILSEHSG
jgi:hypothetical protein